MVESSTSQFEIKQATLQSVFSLVEDQLKKQVDVSISPEQAVNPPIDQHFICIICHDVVWSPKECISCDSLFCQKCIEKWQSNSTANDSYD